MNDHIGRRRKPTGLPVLLVLALVLSMVALTPAQSGAQKIEPRLPLGRVVAVYVILGGLSGGIGHAAKHRSIPKGILEGAIGGAIVTAGKCIIAQGSGATDWVGRQTVAIGSSTVANALKAQPIGQLSLPFFVLQGRTNFSTRTGSVRLDLPTTLVSGYLLLKPHSRFLPRDAATHGAMTFEDASASYDLEVAGAVVARPSAARTLITHELIHVTQNDFISIAWGDPLQDWLAPRIPYGPIVNRYVEVGVLEPVWAVISSSFDRHDRPWEREARSFARGC